MNETRSHLPSASVHSKQQKRADNSFNIKLDFFGREGVAKIQPLHLILGLKIDFGSSFQISIRNFILHNLRQIIEATFNIMQGPDKHFSSLSQFSDKMFFPKQIVIYF